MNKSMGKICFSLAMLMALVSPAFSQVGIFEEQTNWGPRGSVSVDGSVSLSGGTYTLQGNGDDIWNADDEGFFAYTQKSGSWVIGGQFTWVDPGTNDWAKVGPMIRDGAEDAGAVNYYAAMRGALDLISPQWREAQDASSGSHGPRIRDENDELVAPEDSTVWLRVTRIAEFDFVFVEWSRDGQNWSLGHSRTLAMSDEVAYGFAITNHEDNDFLAEATVSNAFLEEFSGTVGARSFSNAQVQTGDSVNVTIDILNPADATITETLPEGWTASNISNGGSASGGVITWSIDSSVSSVSYEVTPGSSATASTFSGEVGGFGTLGDNAMTLLQSSVGDFESHADIGAVQATGSASFDGGNYTVQGSGDDIWNTADAFHFVFSEFEGPFRISGEVLVFPFESTSDWVKGGLMVRNNLTPGSSNGFIEVRTDLQMNSQARPAQGEASVGVADLTDAQFGQMIIERQGNSVIFTRIDLEGNENEDAPPDRRMSDRSDDTR